MSPSSRRAAAAIALAALTGLAAAHDVELYEQPGFAGVRLTLSDAAPDLAGYALGERVSSLVVLRGQWEFCTRPQYRGECITVGPGRYATLPRALDDRLASLRRADGDGPAGPRPPPPGPPGQPAIVLYVGPFDGPELRLSDAVSDLRSRGFNDRAGSVDVLAGHWELCSDGGFGGRCQRVPPGRHLLPPELDGRLSSLRPLGGAAPVGPPPLPPLPPVARPGGGRPWPGAAPAIVFYEHADGVGRQLPLYAAMPDFNEAGFNDIASSVEVLRGRWQVCRHVDFGGECIVLGPGRHALHGRLHDGVSSARPVHLRDERPIGGHPAVTLYERVELSGRALFVDAETVNLRDLDFNDRATAIEVHGGRWELCSASHFRGRCAVFGPGWHRLPDGIAAELSSLRPR